jgi:acyl carrier protein
MMTHGYNELREMVLEIIAHKIEAAGLNRQEFDDDIDLLQSGLIDSFDFLDLIAEIETRSGIEIDLAKLDESDFTTLRGFMTKALGVSEA